MCSASTPHPAPPQEPPYINSHPTPTWTADQVSVPILHCFSLISRNPVKRKPFFPTQLSHRILSFYLKLLKLWAINDATQDGKNPHVLLNPDKIPRDQKEEPSRCPLVPDRPPSAPLSPAGPCSAPPLTCPGAGMCPILCPSLTQGQECALPPAPRCGILLIPMAEESPVSALSQAILQPIPQMETWWVRPTTGNLRSFFVCSFLLLLSCACGVPSPPYPWSPVTSHLAIPWPLPPAQIELIGWFLPHSVHTFFLI